MSDFSTLNESRLHNTLKKIYAFQTDGKTEVEKDGHIYDIITKKGEVIEIQNQSLSHLKGKIKDTLEKGIKITVVYPVVTEKKIILCDSEKKILKKSRSPKKGSIYDIFNEIKGIWEFLLEKKFTLEVPFIEITEIRTKEENPVQSKNRKRRFKKDWNKSGKKLDSITDSKSFSKKEDYLSLLPKELPDEFSSKDLEKALRDEKVSERICKNSNLILWVLFHMNIIRRTKKESRLYFYEICK